MTITVTGGSYFETTYPGGSTRIHMKVRNNGVSPAQVTLACALHHKCDDYIWSVGGPEVQSAVGGTELYGHGPVNDVMTVPPGGVGYLDITVLTNARMMPEGTVIPIDVIVDGVPYVQTVRTMKDLAKGERDVISITGLLATLFGLRDDQAYALPEVQRLQDLANRGLRFWHLFLDLQDRRGYPVEIDGCNRTVLGENAVGVSGRPIIGATRVSRPGFEFNLPTEFPPGGIVVVANPPDKSPNRPDDPIP